MKAEELLLGLVAAGGIAYLVAKSGESKGGGGGIFPVPIEKPITLPGFDIKFPEIKFPEIRYPPLEMPKIEIPKIPKYDFSWMVDWQKNTFDFLKDLIDKLPKELPKEIPKELPKEIPKGMPKGEGILDKVINEVKGFAWEFFKPWLKNYFDFKQQVLEANKQAAEALRFPIWHWHPMPKAGGASDMLRMARQREGPGVTAIGGKVYSPLKDLQNMMSKAKTISKTQNVTKKIIPYKVIPASVRAKHSAGAIYDYIKNTIGLGPKGTVTFYGSGFGSLSNKIVIS